MFLPENPDGLEPTVTAMKEETLIQSLKADSDENETEDGEEDRIMTEDESEKTQSAVGKRCLVTSNKLLYFIPMSKQFNYLTT